jgi:arginyl-tRNA synthetase
MKMDFKKEIVALFSSIVTIDKDLIEIPPNLDLGDYAVPCFKLAKQLRKSPAQIAQDISQQLADRITLEGPFIRIEAAGPYVNIAINRALLIESVLVRVFATKDAYGTSTEGEGKVIVVDYSSPNIAKPFGIAHIRSTVIGNAICKLYAALGYHIIGINHLGDWGTQFGKLMVAYRQWGDETRLVQEGIDYLVKIYIEFGNRAKEDPSLDDEARAWFKRLEEQDPEAVALWQRFRDLSLEEFNKYYEELDIHFDYIQGEAFYNDRLQDTIEYIKERVPTEMSEGALIVRLDEVGIDTPVILQKSDEASTYHTRDFAAALYRLQNYDPDRILYIVGTPQILHFRQLFAVLEKMGEDPAKFVHVPFGNMTYSGKMMSTRKGNFVLLRDVLQRSVELADQIISAKNPDLANKEEIAKQIGIGAVIFGDLTNDRTRDVDFTWEKVLNFEGDTAPYLQYTHARICSIKRKAVLDVQSDVQFNLLIDSHEFELAKLLDQFPSIVAESAQAYKPNILTNYLITLAQAFNQFYNHCPILKEVEALRDARLLLAEDVRIVLAMGLGLLGIHSPEEM